MGNLNTKKKRVTLYKLALYKPPRQDVILTEPVLGSRTTTHPPKSTLLHVIPVGLGRRICQLILCRRAKTPTTSNNNNNNNECPAYNTKLQPVLMLWGMWSAFSLPLLPDPLWFKVVVPVRVPSMGQLELFHHLLYLKSFNYVQTND